MKKFCLLLCVFLINSLQAEVINHVEYQLPKNGKEWEVFNKLDSGQGGTTLIYAPKGSDKNTTLEFFGVNSNSLPSDPNDTDTFKVALSKLFPTMNIEVSILEKWPNSALYEWTATDKQNGKKMVYGWTRVFSKNGTITLNYTTALMDKLEESKATWLPLLKQAHFEESKELAPAAR